MKTVNCMLVAFLLLGLGAAAGHGQDQGSAGTNPFSTIKIETRCEAMADNVCPGRFGFAVDSQGNFTAGPDPSGKTVSGVITSDELKQLMDSVLELTRSAEVLTCREHPIPAISMTVSVLTPDGKKRDIFFSGKKVRFSRQGDECFGGSPQKAGVVRETIRKLLAKYYPVPFSTEKQ